MSAQFLNNILNLIVDEEEDDEEKIKAQSKNKLKKENSKNSKNSENIEIIHKDDVIPAPQKISNKNYRLFDKILHTEEKESEYFKTCLSKNEELINEIAEMIKNFSNFSCLLPKVIYFEVF
jgi:hypothetical protein